MVVSSSPPHVFQQLGYALAHADVVEGALGLVPPLIARADLPARVCENGCEGYRHAARRPLIVQPVIPRLVNRVDADGLRLWRAVIVVYAVYGVNDVFVAHA